MDELTQRFIDSYNYLEQNNYVAGKSDFANKIGVSSSMVTEIVKGRSKPGSTALQNIVKEFPIDATWLLINRGSMIREDSNSENTPVITSIGNEQNLDNFANTPAPKSGAKTDHKQIGVHPSVHPTRNNSIILTPQFITVDNKGDENILHISQRAAAGYLNGFSDPEYLGRQQTFNLPGLTDATYRSFEVIGDSMYPTLKSGQMVIGRWVEKLDYIREDRVHIVVHKTRGIIIKRLLNRLDTPDRVIVCKSDATNDRELYRTFTIVPEDVHEIWYAVFHGGFDFQSPGDMWKRLNNNEADLTLLQSRVEKLLNVVKTAGLLNE